MLPDITIEESVDGHVPRLDVVCAIAGGMTAFITGEVVTTPDTIRVSYEALVTGVLVGALVGWGVRFSLSNELPDASPARRWWPVVIIWLAGGTAASAVVSVGTHLMTYGGVDSFTLEAFGAGLGGTVLSLPACLWLSARARAARRARHGSLVAASEERAIFGALIACVALETLFVIPGWRLAHYGVAPPPSLALSASCSAVILAIVLLWRDRHAERRVAAYFVEIDTLDDLGAASLPSTEVADLGIGSDVYGRREHGQAYRSGHRRVPLLRGSPEHAAAVLRRSILVSWLRIAIVCLPAIAHLYEATHPPRDAPRSMLSRPRPARLAW